MNFDLCGGTWQGYEKFTSYIYVRSTLYKVDVVFKGHIEYDRWGLLTLALLFLLPSTMCTFTCAMSARKMGSLQVQKSHIFPVNFVA